MGTPLADPRPRVFSKRAVRLLLELASEHPGHVRLQLKEGPDRIEVMVLADSQELERYLRYMVERAERLANGRPTGAC